MLRELGRFRTKEGASLASIALRLSAVDARDGRAVAATADVDRTYRLADQLHVQPDERLAACFDAGERIAMTRQEVAVARSHVEAWKSVAAGSHRHVMVLEDDVWFGRGAAVAIDRGWRAALRRRPDGCGPCLVYFSYADADGTAERADPCDALFRPVRGLWFLSGYVLSREGAAALLRSMPVVGPVDMWVNRRFGDLGALALARPAILQAWAGASDNSYSIMPYLARAGIVDASAGPTPPGDSHAGPVIAWTAGGERESLAMALSMLGLRVRAFGADERALGATELFRLLATFDALVDPPLAGDALTTAIGRVEVRFVTEAGAANRAGVGTPATPASRSVTVPAAGSADASWTPLCDLLGLAVPIEGYPVGAPRKAAVFRDGRAARAVGSAVTAAPHAMDASPWILPAHVGWQPACADGRSAGPASDRVDAAAMTAPTPSFPGSLGTFPGNLAAFAAECLIHDADGARLVVRNVPEERPYRSGAFASARPYGHGRFQAEIIGARAVGVVTGFFLHRDAPRQEIDIELPGDDLSSMLVNVYFNPGDEGAGMAFGYRGSPCRIDLGFDAAAAFHLYAIDWRPDRIAWSVDDRIVHERTGWDPTPIPHLPMLLHGNLWVPRSPEVAGQADGRDMPATAVFRNVSIHV